MVDGDLQTGDFVDNYVVIGVLGSGAMGVVYAAYDAKLDRKVALKLLAAGDRDERRSARLLREARALARLNHPNVVTIHQAGTHAERAWIAMEFVDGLTLKQWLRDRRRGWRDVVGVMRLAGAGLAAAHGAGLLHRDFKPDNVMVGGDGRVRVMDFGLARSRDEAVTPGADTHEDGLGDRLTRTGRILGTPAYMPLEQLTGGPGSPKSDQFSFFVTLWEALTGQRPFAAPNLTALAVALREGMPHAPDARRRMPTWLRRACERGLAVRPEDRFESMDAVLEVLRRGEASARRRTLATAGGAVAILAAGGYGAQQIADARDVAACNAAGARVANVWNDDARRRVHEGLLATGVAYAQTTSERVAVRLDAYADAWRDARLQACLNFRVHERWTADTLDRATWCLDERHRALSSLVGRLQTADARSARGAVKSAAGLVDVSPCLDADHLGRGRGPPPAARRREIASVRGDLARAQTLSAAGRHQHALDVVRAVREAAQTLDWPPLSAGVQEVEADLLVDAGDLRAAEAAAVAAYREAFAAQAWNVAGTTALQLAHITGYRTDRFAAGHAWAGHAKVAVGLAGDPLGLGGLAHVEAQGVVLYAEGKRAEALERFQQVLERRREIFGEGHPAVANSLNNVGSVSKQLGRYDEAEALLREAVDVKRAALGHDHPDVASSLGGLATVIGIKGEHARARALQEEALAIHEKALGPNHPDVASSLRTVGIQAFRAGDFGDAKAFLLRGLAIYEKTLGRDHPRVAPTLQTLGAVHAQLGEYDRAQALLVRALQTAEGRLGPKHPRLAPILNDLGVVLTYTGRYTEAAKHHERALEIRQAALGPDHPDVASSLTNLVSARLPGGQTSELWSRAQRALEILEAAVGPTHAELAPTLSVLGHIRHEQGGLEESSAFHQRALSIVEQAHGRDYLDVAPPLLDLAVNELEGGRAEQALPLLERAVAIFDRHEGISVEEPPARFQLARALVATGGDQRRALAQAQDARKGFEARGATKSVNEIDAWLLQTRRRR